MPPKRERVDPPARKAIEGVHDAIDASEAATSDNIDGGLAHSAASSHSPDGAAMPIAPPASPASNRERFRAACMPSQITCDLSCVQSDPGLRFSFQAIVLICYPAQTNPARRHVLLADGNGIAGVTVWNANVNAFSSSSIGRMAHFTKMSLVIHNNTRAISMNKESSVTFSDGTGHFAHTWWHALPLQKAIPAIHFSAAKENSIVNIEGVLGSAHSELKLVKNEPKELLTLRIVDRTGIIQVRSWNHSVASFHLLVDKPIRIERLRVAGFASSKVGELLDGGASRIETDFPGAADVAMFWAE